MSAIKKSVLTKKIDAVTNLPVHAMTHKVTVTLACLEALETHKLRLISAPCEILPEVSSDAMFTVAKDASTMGIAGVLLQD
jgi:hypothetical protein